MSMWLTMLKKDIWMLKNQWLGFLGGAVIVTALVLSAHSLGIVDAARTAVAVGVVLTGSLLVVFPAQLYRGMNQEIKGSAALWLQTPKSGWAMYGSKLISSLIASLLYFVISYFLALALFHSVNITHSLPPVHYQTQTHGNANEILMTQHGTPLNVGPVYLSVLAAQIPRILFFAMTFLFCFGLYLSLWLALIYLSVRAVKSQFKKLSWLVGLGVVLVATWGLGGLKSTALYAQAFGWGRVAVLDLFPSDVRTLLARHLIGTIVIGHFVFDAIIGVVLFSVTGLITDRYLEV